MTRPRGIRTAVLVAIAASTQPLAPAPLSGQLKLECVEPSEACRARIASGSQTVELQVKATAGSAELRQLPVVFRLKTEGITGERGVILDTVKTDSDGIARFHWSGRAPAKPITVVASARDATSSGSAGGAIAVAELTIEKHDPGPAVTTLRPDAGDGQVWRPGKVLGKPVRILLNGPNQKKCEGLKLAFDSRGDGEAMPDTARAKWDGGGCVAETQWKLGSHVGKHEMAVRTVGAKTEMDTVVSAVARKGARISVGIGLRFGLNPFRVVDDGLRTAKATSEENGVTVTRDTMLSRGSEVETKTPGSPQVDPIIGVDWPVLTRVEIPGLHPRRARLFAGVSLDEPTRIFHAGLHLIQLFTPEVEVTDVGIYAGLQGTRRTVPVGDECGAGGACADEDDWDFGLSILVAVDGSSFLGNLVNALGG